MILSRLEVGIIHVNRGLFYHVILLSGNNRITIFYRVMENKFCCNLDNRDILREAMKIGLERIDT